MTDTGKRGCLLICEPYPGLREALAVTAGGGYDLTFTDTPAEISSVLTRRPFRLVVWDIDRYDPSAFPGFLEHLDQPLDLQVAAADCLDTLRAIRRVHPDLPVVLLAHEFEYDFQVAILQQCRGVHFLTKHRALDDLTERLQVILGDKPSAIREWIVRIPVA